MTGDLGFPGPTGPQGPPGPPGSPFWRASWSDYVDVPPLGDVTVSAACPAGEQAAGGGFNADGASVTVNHPMENLGGWEIEVTGGVLGGHARVVAVCGHT